MSATVRARIGKGRAVHLVANDGAYCGALIRTGYTPVDDSATCLNCLKVERAVIEGRGFVPMPRATA